MSELPEKLNRSPSIGTITKPATAAADVQTAPAPPKVVKSEPAAPKIDKSAPATTPLVGYALEEKNYPQKSQSSLRSDDGITRGREIQDTFMGRLLYIQSSFFSILITCLLIYFLFQLNSTAGVTLPFGGQIFHQTIPIILEVWMHICFLSTDSALTSSLAAYFGYELSQKHGYSLIVCGFIQSSIFAKIQFSGLLNFRSKYKKVVSRASMTWALHLCMLILTFFCSTSISISTTRYDSGTLLCVLYGQDGVPVDRGWPTIDTAAGEAEFLFGTSLGLLTSEMAVPNSTLVTFPQLIDSCADGTYIIGKGLTTNFQTTCECSASQSVADIIDAGVPLSMSSQMITLHQAFSEAPGWTNYISYSSSGTGGNYGSINVTTMMAGTSLCGGANYSNLPIPICVTQFGEHNFADVEISWMNDGRNSRSAPKAVNALAVNGPAKTSWLYQALINAYGGEISSSKIPGFYPGTVTPLWWWMTPNLQATSASGLVPGMETSVAIMLRMGITRTYSVSGTSCTQNLEDKEKTTINMSNSGLTIGLVFAVFELVLAVASILLCVPWFLYKDPIIPAIRLVSDRTYFNIMLCKNSTGNLLRIIGSTADRTDIWPKLDMEVRVGENIQTVSDQDTGEIIVDKPQLVTSLSWTKCY